MDWKLKGSEISPGEIANKMRQLICLILTLMRFDVSTDVGKSQHKFSKEFNG